jgi:hypothetical protein
MSKIAVLVTTFKRDKLLFDTIASIIEYWNDDYVLLVGDQGELTDEKCVMFDKLSSLYNVHYCGLPYDCGLSFARNYLVKKAEFYECDYCLLLADSLQPTQVYDFEPIIKFLNGNIRRGIVGFSGGKECIPWEYNMELIKNEYFLLKQPNKQSISDALEIFQCDLVKNIFLAKTKCLLANSWDEDLKMAEHEDFFWRLKNNLIDFSKEYGEEIFQPYQVFYTPSIEVKHVKAHDISKEYKQLRDRTYTEFRQLLLKKYGIKRWVKYEQE